jgi:hypothetical protein
LLKAEFIEGIDFVVKTAQRENPQGKGVRTMDTLCRPTPYANLARTQEGCMERAAVDEHPGRMYDESTLEGG